MWFPFALHISHPIVWHHMFPKVLICRWINWKMYFCTGNNYSYFAIHLGLLWCWCLFRLFPIRNKLKKYKRSAWILSSRLHISSSQYYTYRIISNIRCTKSQNLYDFCLVLHLSLFNLLTSGAKSRMKMYSWSSADRRCTNYIWVINNIIAYSGAPYIRGLTVIIRSPSLYLHFVIDLLIKLIIRNIVLSN